MNPTQNKQLAFDYFEKNRAAFLWKCRIVAEDLALRNTRNEITIDEVRERCPLPLGVDGRVYGAVFNTDEWEKVGYTQTKVKTSHGRPVAIFRLKEKSYSSSLVEGQQSFLS